MNERAQRIKKLVMESGKTYQELEQLTGVKKSTLQRYASGVTTKIPLDVVDKLEKAFGVSRGYIMGWDAPPEDLGALAAKVLVDPNLLKLVQNYLSMNESDQYALRLMAESLVAKEQKKTDAETSAEKSVVVGEVE